MIEDRVTEGWLLKPSVPVLIDIAFFSGTFLYIIYRGLSLILSLTLLLLSPLGECQGSLAKGWLLKPFAVNPFTFAFFTAIFIYIIYRGLR